LHSNIIKTATIIGTLNGMAVNAKKNSHANGLIIHTHYKNYKFKLKAHDKQK